MRAISRRLFIEHPASVGETYLEHCVHAASFGVSMLLGALACFVHAVVPGCCTTTGSRLVAHLHERMLVNRPRSQVNQSNLPSQPDYIAEHI
jgi:hypothetical protein